MSWHAALHRLQQAGEPHALASVVGAAGSTPREPGAKMVITADAVHDTLGGGGFEYQVIDVARQALRASQDDGQGGPRLEAFPLGARSGQCCGGYVHVLIEVFPGAEMTVAVFGAGHVGQALVQLLVPLPWRLAWFDSRDGVFPDWATGQPRLACRRSADPASDAASLPAHSHVLVMTHDHGEDRALIDALLGRDDLASIGLIGSPSKWASFRRRLAAAGHNEAALTRVRCPIGIPRATGKRPYEIALAVAAELLTLTPASASEIESERHAHRGIEPRRLREVFSSAPVAAPFSATSSSATPSGDPG
ncbi:xanthine dehydrogenase accessory protein XdhC [Halomonas sp. IOP_31]|uniref:xanthine dehydrogenase accessory protein XdhC n=1 Tax=Halomonas sp. IOP_31 TaxID=2876584 RepID=UPI001E63CA1A|nr:xanthine dehydrogenase accessory protein XdhC [Halomonas sp. IOP_31]MCD6007822.1 xanthine dehydrogenase accessory protein XdhC [Halomonas sp. IOP_31]